MPPAENRCRLPPSVECCQKRSQGACRPERLSAPRSKRQPPGLPRTAASFQFEFTKHIGSGCPAKGPKSYMFCCHRTAVPIAQDRAGANRSVESVSPWLAGLNFMLTSTNHCPSPRSSTVRTFRGASGASPQPTADRTARILGAVARRENGPELSCHTAT